MSDNDMIFEWDDSKETVNIKKHGISFRLAAKIFIDPNCIEIYDSLHSIFEDCYIAIGYAGNVITVVYMLIVK